MMQHQLTVIENNHAETSQFRKCFRRDQFAQYTAATSSLGKMAFLPVWRQIWLCIGASRNGEPLLIH
jgi:hypothetical protein